MQQDDSFVIELNGNTGDQICFCIDSHFTTQDFIDWLNMIEEKTGLKLMAKGDQEPEILNGFATMCHQEWQAQHPFCDWGKHRLSKYQNHTSIIISFYKEDSDPNPEVKGGSSHFFKKTLLDNELISHLKTIHSDYLFNNNFN